MTGYYSPQRLEYSNFNTPCPSHVFFIIRLPIFLKKNICNNIIHLQFFSIKKEKLADSYNAAHKVIEQMFLKVKLMMKKLNFIVTL